MPSGGLAFYNCGEHSGHSQPHKHMQLLPLPLSSSHPGPTPMEVHLLAAAAGKAPGEAFVPASLPFLAHCALVPPTAVQAEATFARLLASDAPLPLLCMGGPVPPREKVGSRLKEAGQHRLPAAAQAAQVAQAAQAAQAAHACSRV